MRNKIFTITLEQRLGEKNVTSARKYRHGNMSVRYIYISKIILSQKLKIKLIKMRIVRYGTPI